jgi:hypothetical protein
MHKTAGQLTSNETIERAAEPKAREASGRKSGKRQADDIHPSLRALPDYPE